MDHQQSNNYLRPPPPAADPYYRPPQVPLPPQSHPWPYSTVQFEYQIRHSASPPAQWLSQQPHLFDHAQYSQPPLPYPAHPPPPYPAHPHYPPSHPLPPRPPHVYAQDFGSGSWSHHQSWDYPTNNNKEDWAEKARAWAIAKAATDNQYSLAGRPEEQNHFHDQHPQSMNPQFPNAHIQQDQASNYQQYPVGVRPANSTGLGQLQESQFISSGQSSYAVEVNVPYAASDGSLIGNSYESTPQQEKSSISPVAYQQEVPSSYSSVSGNENSGDRYEKFNSSSSLHVASMPHLLVQPLPPPSDGRSGWTEEHHHLLSSQPAESAGLSDEPLNFAPHFNRNLDQHMHPNYALPLSGPVRNLDPVSISSNYAWPPPSAAGVIFPPVTPPIPSGPQVDHPIAVPSPASGHSALISPTGHGFQPAASLIGASFGVSSGVVSHSTASFSVDAYCASERPKKVSVPNWLREEIMKSKASIRSSAPRLSQEDSQLIEDDNNDKYSRKGDQTDSKSIDSSQSNEDADEDGNEDEDVEAARTAAINKEIKRVLTEVLLKVTDELFDEIATKVLNEDDLSVEVGKNIDSSNHHGIPSTPTISTPAASAKVLIPTKILKIDNEDDSDKSTSGSTGDVLGLASYASDEEDDEIKISGKVQAKESSMHQQSSSNKLPKETPSTENGDSRKEIDEHGNLVANVENNDKMSSIVAAANLSAAGMELNAYTEVRDLAPSNTQRSSKKFVEEEEMQHNGSDIPMPKKSVSAKVVEKNERSDGNLVAKMSSDDSRSQKSGNKSDKNDIHENKRNLVGKDKESEGVKLTSNKKGDEDLRRHEERHSRTDMNCNYPKDKAKEKGRIGEKAKDSGSSKRPSPSDVGDGRSNSSRDKRTSAKGNSYEKQLDKTRDEKKDRSRYKSGSSRHIHHRSSSVGSRDSCKDDLKVRHSHDSCNESSDDSKRKSHQSKRHKSPSHIRSRKRQVSRSPHSKNSKRRHSPYSSLETARGRRSRSRSPVHRRR